MRQTVKLRFDGKYNWLPEENRVWTIMSHFIDKDGADRYRSSFGLEGLVELGIVPQKEQERV